MRKTNVRDIRRRVGLNLSGYLLITILMGLSFNIYASGAVVAPASLTPAGLSPGDNFYLVFLSSDGHRGDLTSAQYNALGDTIAANGTETTQISGWQVLYAHDDGSIFTTATTTIAGGGNPIYNINLDKIADDSAAMWDGDIDNPLNFTETGGSTTESAWTGFDDFGVATGNPLAGGGNCTRGEPRNLASGTWAEISTFACNYAGGAIHLYVISPLLVVAPADPEPSNHPTDFIATATSTSQITNGWTDSNAGQLPAGYLVQCKETTGGTPAPVDGTAQADDTDCSDGEGVQNIAYGTTNASWTGLDANTQYHFNIYPYTNSGTSINYKTNGLAQGDGYANATTQAVDDGDGVDSAIESAVPDADGSGTGDGNNDGTADTTQAHVSSLKTNDGNNYVTLDNTDDLNLTEVTASPAPTDLPAGVTFPYDMIGFTANGVANATTVTMDIFYPYNPAINGFWKKGNDGAWHNVSTSISHIGTTKTKITISLVEGGNFDTDGANNGTLTDPGAAGIAGATAIPTLSEWMLILLSLTLGFFAAIKIRSPQREDLMFK